MASMFKVRGGKDTYIKRDGTIGTAGKGALVSDECAFTLATVHDQTCFDNNYEVRRLIPMEYERLQGFPDDWTNIEWRGKPAPDSKRYKALGNSMAVPVMRWIGERIESVEGFIRERDS